MCGEVLLDDQSYMTMTSIIHKGLGIARVISIYREHCERAGSEFAVTALAADRGDGRNSPTKLEWNSIFPFVKKTDSVLSVTQRG